MEALLIALGLALAFYIAWCIGTNDAANPTNTTVGAGALTLNKAILIFGLFAFIGAIVQGWMVIKTFGRGITEIKSIVDAVTASAATATWITFASYNGLPISTTQTSVGSVMGVGLASLIAGKGGSINVSVLIKIFLSWITSPLGAIFLAALFYRSFEHAATSLARGGWDVDRIFRAVLIGALAYSAYSFGANDVGNATGVYLSVISIGGISSMTSGIWTSMMLAAIGALGILIGGFTLGRRVIKTIAFGITRLDYITGSAAGLANALVIWLFTTVPAMMWGWGMPVSTTHASVSAVLGVGLAKYGIRGINWRTFIKILISWFLTVPIAALLSIAIRWLVMFIGGS